MTVGKRKNKNRMKEETKATIRERADYVCEAMIPEAGCSWRGTDIHHRHMRSQGGQHTVENGVLLCRECHSYIHMHPAIAYTNGWLVKSTKNPLDIPFRRRGGFIVLTEDGEFETATAEPLEL